eukprot:TRINITY_DN41454_c0_g1_i1.p1 TRINITY_DN41454_c0_g1~~TRINITY_DN41454_c0_g1_i1.p1  ORF type:complete len:371 (+),score=35.62 TRINITY_DN41454_c0_g1_i1:83-1195(+)
MATAMTTVKGISIGVKNTFIDASLLDDTPSSDDSFARQSSAPDVLCSHDTSQWGIPERKSHGFLSSIAEGLELPKDITTFLCDSSDDEVVDGSMDTRFVGEHHTPVPLADQLPPCDSLLGLEAPLRVEISSPYGFASECGQSSADVGVPYEWQGKTSVMVRNISYKCTRQILDEELREAGFEGLFDYLYLPQYSGNQCSKGFAYINFLDPGTAYRFKQAFHCLRTSRICAGKRLRVVPANLQGYVENVTHRVKQKAHHQNGDADDAKSLLEGTDRYHRSNVNVDEFAVARQRDLFSSPDSGYPDKLYNMPLPFHEEYENRLQLLSHEAEQSDRVPLRICDQCGAQISAADRFCQFCGNPLRSGRSGVRSF